MARRRRRIATEIKIKYSSLFAFILLNLLIKNATSHHTDHHHYNQHLHLQQQQQHQHHHTSGGNNNNNNNNNYNYNQRLDFSSQADYNTKLKSPLSSHQQSPSTAAHLCSLLPNYVSKHLKLCKLIAHSADADEAVTLGASRALAECRAQFKSDRWNCTHSYGDHQLLTSELAQSIGNRESGFLHAIAAAGIVHSIATACSVGNLSDCTCDKTRIGLIRKQEDNFKWGGCSNNIRHGMLFAKNLVELLDAVHLHSRSNKHNHQHYHHHQHQHAHAHHHHQLTNRNWIANNQQRLGKRSLSSRYREPNQLRGRLQTGAITTPVDLSEQVTSGAGGSSSSNSNLAPPSYCQRNHNISQAAHLELIESLLSKNSLEKHQEFRLAMNMHNNKVGRMAVAKNMVFRCRCHGLSGSCSLKTCWLTLPNFQIIGDYLRKKYEASIHLPTALNVNKLIPMMDRNELSAILSGQLGHSNPIQTTSTTLIDHDETTAGPSIGDPSVATTESVNANATAPATTTANTTTSNRSGTEPLLGDQEPLMADAPSPARVQLSGHFIPVTPVSSSLNPPSSTALNPVPLHYNYYERHKQLLGGGGGGSVSQSTPLTSDKQQQQDSVSSSSSSSDSMQNLNNIAPLSQQQYQALLKEMKLCNNSTNHLTTRDLNHQQDYHHQQQHHLQSNQLQVHKKHLNSQQQQNSFPIGAHQNQNLIKSANQHLSQLLQSNKDDLIHLHKSPDYCEADLKHGYPGIQSRVCSNDPLAPDNCDKLCCGRGYTKRVYQETYRCDCKFQYCCSIYCSVCEREIKLLVCN